MLFLLKKENMGKVISLTNSKGGSGKSTMTIFLASVIGKMGYRVLLVDCDVQESIVSTHRIAIKMGDEIYFDIVGIDMTKKKYQDDEYLFFNMISEYQEKYDIIFIDMPGRGDGSDIQKILYNVEYALIPFGYGDTDIDATYKFIEEMKKFKYNMKKDGMDMKIGVFFNNHNKSAVKSQNTIKEVVESLKNDSEIIILKDKKEYVCLADREIYKTLEYGHTPLELKRNNKNKNAVGEFEMFVKSFIQFIK